MHLRNRHVLVPFCALALVGWQGRQNASRNGFDACKLLAVDDVTPLLGPGATSLMTQGGQLCTFTSADHHKKLMVRTPESSRYTPEDTFEKFRSGPHAGFAPADDKDLGDHAVSAVTPYGLEFMVLKNGHILAVQYGAGYGVKGTPEMMAQAKPVVKKAVAAF